MVSARTLQNCDDSTRYQAAKTMLRRRILSGEIAHGEQFQPEVEICRDTNLSRTTVRKAIADLVEEGLLVRYRGRGTFVTIQRSAMQKKLLVFFGCRHGNIRGAYEEMIRGAESTASGNGYQLLLVNSRNDVATSFEQVMRLNEQRVAGTILVPIQSDQPQQATADLVAALRRSGQRVVLLDEFSADEKTSSVCSQNREATHALTKHLIKLGHRRIAFASCLRTEPVAEREEGFRAAMEEHGLEIPPEYFLEVASRDPARQGRQEVDVFMAMRHPPQAIVALHDLIAMNMIQRAGERGWKVPQDVAIVGFDDLPQAAYSHPPLTTVHQPFHEMGALAVKRLIEQLEKDNAPIRHERLPCNLVIRTSCGSQQTNGARA